MKHTMTRSISALAVTGALVLTGAGAAQAHDHDGDRGDRSSYSGSFRGDDARGDRDGDRDGHRHGEWRGPWGGEGRSADHRQDGDHRRDADHRPPSVDVTPPPADDATPPPAEDTDETVTFDDLTAEQQRLFLQLVGQALSDGVFDTDEFSAVVDQFEEQTGVDLVFA